MSTHRDDADCQYARRECRNTTGFPLNADFADTPAAKDTLGASIEAFLAAVRGEAPRPIVTATEAIRALDLALAAEQGLTPTNYAPSAFSGSIAT